MVNADPAAPGAPSTDWLSTPLGAYLVDEEQRHYDAAVVDLFGYNAIQVGPNVVDLVILPHVLEFSLHPHQILREVERILMPDGHLLISGLNPWSLWGIRRTLAGGGGEFPWQGEYISLLQLKDWLTLLGFEVTAGRMGCYAPPFAQQKWLGRCRFMESAGNRWWPFAGGVYFLQAVKRVVGMKVIMPRWTERSRVRPALAVVPRRVRQPDAAAARQTIQAAAGGDLRLPRSGSGSELSGDLRRR